MGFYIKCCRGAEIVLAGQTTTISAGQIKQVVEDTTLISEPSSKSDEETRQATFVATTPEGQITWHVFFNTGDGDAYVEDVVLVGPSDIVVQSNPEFKIRDSDS